MTVQNNEGQVEAQGLFPFGKWKQEYEIRFQ